MMEQEDELRRHCLHILQMQKIGSLAQLQQAIFQIQLQLQLPNSFYEQILQSYKEFLKSKVKQPVEMVEQFQIRLVQKLQGMREQVREQYFEKVSLEEDLQYYLTLLKERINLAEDRKVKLRQINKNYMKEKQYLQREIKKTEKEYQNLQKRVTNQLQNNSRLPLCP